MAYSFSSKAPARGDKVIDYNRVLDKEGEIISGVFDATDPDNERVADAYVEFGGHRSDWFSLEQLKNCWCEDEQAYILNSEAEDGEDGDEDTRKNEDA